MNVARSFNAAETRGTLLRLVLTVCVWQGPLPYWHAHLATADAAGESEALVEHLRIWHVTDDSCSDECLHGHWHFEYPHAPDDGEPPSRPAKDRLATLAAAGIQFVAAEQVEIAPSPLDTLGPLDIVAGRLDAPGRNTATHFFDGFAPTLSPPLRFGILRC